LSKKHKHCDTKEESYNFHTVFAFAAWASVPSSIRFAGASGAIMAKHFGHVTRSSVRTQEEIRKLIGRGRLKQSADTAPSERMTLARW
jgi:hypothetical protein